ncbi:MAG: hydrogenase nickel incorporation protein HypB [Spirulinaceae cyanobacterium]
MHQTLDAAWETHLLHLNQAEAERNRAHFDEWGISCVNIISAPGAGKTALLERTLAALSKELQIAIIEGDISTELDAQKLRQYDVPVIAIQTKPYCRLDSKMVAGGIKTLLQNHDPSNLELVLVENIGNLVCPAELAIGEHAKVALLSITEGEDQPLKYPAMFQAADCLLLTKIDLAPYLDVDIAQMAANIRKINPDVTILPISAKTGIGLEAWFDWLETTTTRTATMMSLWFTGLFSATDWLDTGELLATANIFSNL